MASIMAASIRIVVFSRKPTLNKPDNQREWLGAGELLAEETREGGLNRSGLLRNFLKSWLLLKKFLPANLFLLRAQFVHRHGGEDDEAFDDLLPERRDFQQHEAIV